MCSKMAAASASISATLAAMVSSTMYSHTPVPTPDTRIWAYGSLIRASSRAVSAARAAATMTAVDPTLVAMSQVSSWVRNVLIGLLIVLFVSGYC
jgi:hypothetical protein